MTRPITGRRIGRAASIGGLGLALTLTGGLTAAHAASPARTSCTAPGQLLGDPSLEQATVWSASTGVRTHSSNRFSTAHTGWWYGELAGRLGAVTNTLSQTVTLPSGCGTYVVSYWLRVWTGNPNVSTVHDTMTVTVNGSTIDTHTNLEAAPFTDGWKQQSVTVTGNPGQNLTLTFTGTEPDGTVATAFDVDDVTLTAS